MEKETIHLFLDQSNGILGFLEQVECFKPVHQKFSISYRFTFSHKGRKGYLILDHQLCRHLIPSGLCLSPQVYLLAIVGLGFFFSFSLT